MWPWDWGARLLGVTAEMDCVATASFDCRVETSLEGEGFSAVYTAKPKVLQARCDVHEVRVRRIGDFDGKLVKELSDEAKSLIMKTLKAQEPKIVEKANAAIRKRSKDGVYRVSLADLLGMKLTPP